MTCDHCLGRGHSPILDENDYSEHAMPDDPYYCACPRGVARRAWETKGIVLDGVTANEGTVMGIDRSTGFDVGEAWYLDLITGEWRRGETPPSPPSGKITGITNGAITVTFDEPAIANGPWDLTQVVAPREPGNRQHRRAAAARARRA